MDSTTSPSKDKGFLAKNLASVASEVKLINNDKPRAEPVNKSKSKKEKRDCLNLRKTLLGTSPRLVILKSAEDLCIKGLDSVKKHKPAEPRVSERLLNTQSNTNASGESSPGQSTPEPRRPAKPPSFYCEYTHVYWYYSLAGVFIAQITIHILVVRVQIVV